MLHGLLYTVKLGTKGTDVRLSTNSATNIEARRDYAEFMLHHDPRVRTVFVDETGFNLWARRSQGRAMLGRPVKRRVTTQRGPNVTVCLAIAAEFGLVHCVVQRGGQTIPRFQDFVNELCERCTELAPDNEWLIVTDGAQLPPCRPCPSATAAPNFASNPAALLSIPQCDRVRQQRAEVRDQEPAGRA